MLTNRTDKEFYFSDQLSLQNRTHTFKFKQNTGPVAVTPHDPHTEKSEQGHRIKLARAKKTISFSKPR